MRRLLLLLLVLLAVPAPASADARPRVVVVVAPGLRWSDVTPSGTPELARLAREGAAGALSVKAGPSVSCPADGLLTLAAGARATAYDAPCAGLPPDPAATAARNRRSRERADVGALVAALRNARLTACGDDALTRLVAQETARCDVQLRDAGTVTGPDRPAAAARVDAAVRAAAAPGALLVVVGLSEAPGDARAHLHVALAAGPGFGPGTLTSASTRRRAYVQLVDVGPTVLTALGVPVPPAMTGQPWQVRPGRSTPAALADLDRRAVEQKAATVPFVVVSLSVQLVLLVLLRHRRRAAQAVALAGAAVPGASFLAGLVPWWRAGAPLLVLLAVSAALAAGAAALALTRRGTRYGPVAVVAGLTAAVLVADLVTGAHLQVTSVTGYSPLVAGRFAGIGNVAFGVYAAAGLLALGRARRLPVLLAGGAVLVLVDGAPPWGSDVGGVLALVPAVVVLALLVTGRRLSLLRLALAGLGGALLVTALALADAARPASQRTHLGRFVGQVRDGTAGDLLHRKAAAVLGLLFHSPVTALLPLVVLAAVLVVRRPPRPLADALADEPAYRSALVALAVACALGFALNDSGEAVPALALVVVLPATVALVSGRREGPGAG